MLDSPLVALPLILNLLILIAGPIIYFNEFEEKICFKMAVVIQMLIRNELEDSLTNAGIIILQVLVSILLLPYMFLMSVFVAITYIVAYLWHWYKYIFRKRRTE